jgi:CheY-like chemotaxis protein/CHASE3 domain sensor protein
VGFGASVLALGIIAIVTYRALQTRQGTAARVSSTLRVIGLVESLHSGLSDADAAQRGFLLTGDERYLAPLFTVRPELSGDVAAIRQQTAGGPAQLQRIGEIEDLVNQRMQLIDESVALRRAGRTDEALAIMRSDRGLALTERTLTLIADMERDERQAFNEAQAEWERAVSFSSSVTWAGSLVLFVLILGAATAAGRDFRWREIDAWIRQGQSGLAARIQGERRLDALGDQVLEYLATYVKAQVGAIYVREGDIFLRVAGYALPQDARDVAIRAGDGLLGQAAKDNRPIHVTQVPPDYLPVGSAVGRSAPRELLIAPAADDGVVQGAIELGFLQPVQKADIELLARISEVLGVAIRSAKDRARLEELLEETQRQASALQAQQEELRVNNEELEEQAEALRESQARLESQQAELEQINAHLEEQSELLERQKEALGRSEAVLLEKTAELERTNQYKSEFLANMSHELRTPLNSSLILSKLLADNKTGNLSDEQVKFAQTISAAGNDLLALINDILDLSRIEAGKVEIAPADIGLARSIEALVKTFQPIAAEKRLELAWSLEPGVPDTMQTDPQRLNQVLKNLLANALKFTDAGGVTLRVYRADPATVAFAVQDTGIGIPESQHTAIFEAFRQADGSTHRKYGGTGLGLSISRDLARLLGGEITVVSAPGRGSTFTLTLPIAYSAPDAAAAAVAATSHFPSGPAPAGAPAAAAGSAGAALPAAPSLAGRSAPITRVTPVPSASEGAPDDRDRLAASSRRILVVEDDVRFAEILRDLSHEMGFQCIVTHTASEGLAAASAYHPDAILLDINLPDHSGLGVLDQLKRRPDTRHIPVHVASVSDFTREALERGAIGYALKPVKREQLVDAFRQLEAKFSQTLRRVLVVEDDERQRESIGRLLSNGDVQITAVENAADALTQLRATAFDCMVMDLNLPDLSGYELLEKMAEQEDVPFPPVIVYTGRSISRDEEQKLHRFSKSIIIKDARSPERLLDEVTLFLHQVESALPAERQRMLQAARDRDAALEGRRILVVEDDARNIFALSSVLEPKGAALEIARNGKEALDVLDRLGVERPAGIDLVLMDIMMPEMDGLTAMREIRKRPEWKKLPIVALTAKAMKDDQEKCLDAGANDYIAKPLDVERLMSLVRVWMPK